MLSLLSFFLLIHVYLTYGAPTTKEPTFTVETKLLQAAINCPQTSQVAQDSVVLIVPGTGEQASSFFRKTLGQLLEKNKYHPCYLDVPNDSVGDMQINAEYVSYAIHSLFRSSNSKIRVVAHSQGCTNVQWALTFWSDRRKEVASFVALGPAWDGTEIAGLVNRVRASLTGGKMVASVLQQTTGSHLLQALKDHGGTKMLVPTTTVMTNTDEIVLPYESGNMAGATNIVLQSKNLCPHRLVDHFTLVTDAISQYAMLNAFEKGGSGMTDLEALEKNKETLCANKLPQFTSVSAGISFTTQSLMSAIQTVVTGKGKSTIVTEEPPLMPYAKAK